MLIKKLNTDLIDALKSKRADEVEALRYLLAQIKNIHFDTRLEPTDEEVVDCIRKTVKQLNQSVESFTINKRPDLAKTYINQIAIFSLYLPSEIDDESIVAHLEDLYLQNKDVVESSPSKFIGVAIASLKSKASGERIVKLAKELLKKK